MQKIHNTPFMREAVDYSFPHIGEFMRPLSLKEDSVADCLVSKITFLEEKNYERPGQ